MLQSARSSCVADKSTKNGEMSGTAQRFTSYWRHSYHPGSAEFELYSPEVFKH